jgi:hypothetical protein
VDNDPPGCLTIPLLVIVVPIRLLWELLSALGRVVRAYVLRPIGWLLHNVLVRPLAWVLGELVLRPLRWVLRVLVLRPLRWVVLAIVAPVGRVLLRHVLRPVGRGVVVVLAILLIPVVYAAEWLGRGIAALWRVALWPLLAAFGRLLARTWWLAGLILFHLLVRPARLLWRVLFRPVLRAVRWAWRATVVPAARWLRGNVWEPARAAGRSVSRALGLRAGPR